MEKEFLHKPSKDSCSVYFILFPEAGGVVGERGSLSFQEEGRAFVQTRRPICVLRLRAVEFLRNKA